MSRDSAAQRPRASGLGVAAARLIAAIVVTLFLGQAGATLIAEVWLAPHCEAYAAAHGIDYDGVLLKFVKKRSRAGRISPCLFSDRTPAKAEVPVRWRELDGVSVLTRFGSDPMIMTLVIGVIGAAGWLIFSPGGRAYRGRRRNRGGVT